jgi:hypothetical protein
MVKEVVERFFATSEPLTRAFMVRITKLDLRV